MFQGLAPNCCSVQEAHHYFVREVKSKHCSSWGRNLFLLISKCENAKSHGVLNAGYFLCIYLGGARLYAYMYTSICVGYIEKYNKLMDIQNMYYIYIHMCLYDIWLPA